MWIIKCDTNELIYQTEKDSKTEKTDSLLPRGRGWESDGVGGWV